MTAGADRRLRWATALLLALFTLIAGLHAAGVVMDFAAAIRDPREFDYGEGIVWQQADLIPGPRMYAAGTGLPFIVFHYPPVFYLLARAALPLAPDFLAAGRMVASASSLLLAPLVTAVILVVTWRPQQAGSRAVVTAVGIGLVVLSLHAVHYWGFRMRVDMPGLVFGLAGLLIAIRADGRYVGTTIALLLCAAAVFSKQTLLPAGVAVFLVGVLRRPGPSLAAAVTAGSVALGAVLWLQHATSGGFLQNILGNNINRLSLWQGYHVMSDEKTSIPVILLALVAAVWLLRSILPAAVGLRFAALPRELAALRRAEPRQAARAMLLLYLVVATLMLPTVFKVGGSFNYLLDWLCAGTLVLGVMAVDLCQDRRRGPQLAYAALLLCLTLSSLLPVFRIIPDTPDPADLAVQQRLIAMIRDAPKPVASENMTLLMRAGTGVVYEPSIATELASVGRWDETPLIDMIRSHGFAFVITNMGPDGLDQRRTPAVNQAFQQAYPRIERPGPGFWIRYPP